MKQKDSLKFTNKIVPDTIWREAYVALSHYPELKDTPITLKFKKNIKKSFMQAQPSFWGIFKNRKKRSYYIFINEKIEIEDEVFTVTSAPSEVIVGWIGHELGHIMDYRNRSGINLLWFGIRYLTSKNYIREAERAADTYAVNHGLGENIIATKDFILNQSNLSEKYKSRIKKLYLSQEEIVELVEELDEIKEEKLNEKD
ncbi:MULTISPECIES: hypothetical protein [unclassified Zunongwangia]|uniref:hypothetical protein n=1 Tax=unclassified Zunongwangia TaxID=2632541 RepID=UPI0022DDEE55|nr:MULTISPECIES: hypothetical protein [unclassified Zunongwangia]WBL23451.1 hypothetical protein PBT89_05705 [Zunongwangia sp. HRR-M8]WBL24604.1 hypothetical protein PBT91_11880 [Zunongwangia sp. HGR-M22]